MIDKHRWALNRQGFFDIKIKQRLRFLKHKAALIKIVFLVFQAVLPLLLLATCLLPAALPRYLVGLAMGSAMLIAPGCIFSGNHG